MNSPTSTMPTPRPQTGTGPSTLRRLTGWEEDGEVAISVMSLSGFVGEEFVNAFARRRQHGFAVLHVDLEEIKDKPDEDDGGQGPGHPSRHFPHRYPLTIQNSVTARCGALPSIKSLGDHLLVFLARHE